MAWVPRSTELTVPSVHTAPPSQGQLLRAVLPSSGSGSAVLPQASHPAPKRPVTGHTAMPRLPGACAGSKVRAAWQPFNMSLHCSLCAQLQLQQQVAELCRTCDRQHRPRGALLMVSVARHRHARARLGSHAHKSCGAELLSLPGCHVRPPTRRNAGSSLHQLQDT